MAYILLLLQVVTTILQPLGNPSALSFQQMYHQCSTEDKDITPLDFVFEHLLNFESIINCFEGEDQEEHHPYQLFAKYSPVAIVIPSHISVSLQPARFVSSTTEYPSQRADRYVYKFYAYIFHPPLA